MNRLNLFLFIAVTHLVFAFSDAAYAQRSFPSAYPQIIKAESSQLYSLKPSQTIFVHFDKTLYTNNENVWFAAYLLEADSSKIARQNVLEVALVNDFEKKIELKGKFLLQNGFSAGSLLLPDSIAAGNYHLIAYANLVDARERPLDVFSQPITIKTTMVSNFEAMVQFAKKVDGVDVSIKIKNTAANSLTPATYNISYDINDGRQLSAKANTDEYVVHIGNAELTHAMNVFNAIVRSGRETKYLSLNIPPAQTAIDARVNFFPEGGALSTGLFNTVGWSVKDERNHPLKTSAVLYEGGDVIDTVKTDGYGFGKFRLTPKGNTAYHLELTSDSVKFLNPIAALPTAVDDRLVMNISNAVADDSLKIQFRNKKPETILVWLHSANVVYSKFDLKTKVDGAVVKIGLGDVPRGLFTVSVADTTGKTIAERVCFAHQTSPRNLQLIADKTHYKQRDLVNVKIHLTDKKTGKPLAGIVSIACVQENRLISTLTKDIDSYTYLFHQIPGLAPYTGGTNVIADKNYLGNVLLNESKKVKYVMTGPYEARPLTVSGLVTNFDKPIKKSAVVITMSDSSAKYLNTDKTGKFKLDAEKMLINAGKKLLLRVNGTDQLNDYRIAIQDPYNDVNEHLLPVINYQDRLSTIDLSNTSLQKLNGFQNIKMLKDVQIKAINWKVLETPFATAGEGKNACGDYVCSVGGLNCPWEAHWGRIYKPVVGKSYIHHAEFSKANAPNLIAYNTTVFYTGCVLEQRSTNILNIDGVNLNADFVSYNTDIITTPERLLRSTLYWEPALKIDENGDAIFSFYTGDVGGAFKVVVQGLSTNGVIAKTAEIVIDEKK